MGKELPHERLKRLRKSKGLTQDGIAKSIGCAPRTYRDWELDKHALSDIHSLEALADLFGVSTDYLLCRTDYTNIGNEDIEKATGLSDKSIEVLRYAMLPECYGGISYLPDIEVDLKGNIVSETENPEGHPIKIASDVQVMNRRTVSFINRVLERVHVSDDPEWGRASIDTIFSAMEDYVTFVSAWIENNRHGEMDNWVTVHYGDRMISGVPVEWLIRRDLLARIEKSLEAIREEYFNSTSTEVPRKNPDQQKKGGNDNG